MFSINEKRKNCFLEGCKLWDQNIIWEESEQKFPHGGIIGYHISIVDYFLARLKVFQLHAILDDSAWAVKATTNHEPGYCYMIPEIPSSCLLGQITGLFFCIYIKMCHPRIFQTLDSWSFRIIPEEKMPLVVLDFECLEGKNVKEFGIVQDGIILGYSIIAPKD